MRLGLTWPAALAVVALLAGCSGQAGAAAVVGGAPISENRVQSAIGEVIEAAEPVGGAQVGTAVIATEQVRRLIEEQLVDELARREGVTVTPTEIDRSIAEVSGQVGGGAALEAQLAAQAGVPPSDIRAFVRTFLLKEELIAAAGLPDRAAAEAQLIADLGALSTELGTEVSPRYGSWNAESVRVGERPFDLAAPPSPAT